MSSRRGLAKSTRVKRVKTSERWASPRRRVRPLPPPTHRPAEGAHCQPGGDRWPRNRRLSGSGPGAQGVDPAGDGAGDARLSDRQRSRAGGGEGCESVELRTLLCRWPDRPEHCRRLNTWAVNVQGKTIGFLELTSIQPCLQPRNWPQLAPMDSGNGRLWVALGALKSALPSKSWSQSKAGCCSVPIASVATDCRRRVAMVRSHPAPMPARSTGLDQPRRLPNWCDRCHRPSP